MVNLDAYSSRIAASQNPFESQMHHYVNIPADWNQSGVSPGGGADPQQDKIDELINKDTGVSWIQVRSDNFSQSMHTIYDGATNTFLLAENLNAGVSGTWSNPAPNNCTFVYPVETSAVDNTNFSDPPVPSGLNGLPNRMKDGGEGLPFPSSGHPGVCNFAFCDGGVKSISDDVDRRVYLQLLTPGGSKPRFTGFVPQTPLSDSDY
ncbi:MAG: DUF1559 domain-containing protein [Planctomycetaceae bacterium]